MSASEDLARVDQWMLSNLPFDLIDKGKISAIKVQLTGPIPYAKLAMSIASQSQAP